MNEERPKTPEIPKAQSAIEFPDLSMREFTRLIHRMLLNPNLGAGVEVSGVSGSGKSNFSQWAIVEAARLGIPFLHIDPHGDSAKKAWRMCLDLPERQRRKIIYWRVADPNCVAAIHPLAHDPREELLSEYERLSRGRIQVELTANIILSAVGESAAGFAFRPVMRKWIVRWLWLLWRSGLTLADAGMLIDPHHPVYDQLVQLAPDAMSRHQLASLSDLRAADLEAEIGSARNRIANILEHPAAEILLSRRHDTIDFREIYDSGTSLIVDLERGEILSDEVQRMFCNVVLNQYLAIVFSTPEAERRRRLCVIDELPVFNESCGPLLERMCTEIRKYLTSFVFLHQGGARFEGRTDNEFLRTIIDMCRVKILFRHNVDAEYFGKLAALAAHRGPRIKHVQTGLQQLTVGHEIVELIDQGEGTSEMTGQTTTAGTTETKSNSDSLTETLTQAVQKVDEQTRAKGRGRATNRAHSNSEAKAQQRTSTRTTNVTRKQTLVPKLETHEVLTLLQFHSKDEIEWAAASALQQLDTGNAIVMIDGVGVWKTLTPEAKNPFSHAPKFAMKKLQEWRTELLKRPEFTEPKKIQAERKKFLDSLLVELRRLSRDSSSGRFGSGSGNPDRRIELIDPEEHDNNPELRL